MNNRILLCVAAGLACYGSAVAQNEQDALRFSHNIFNGTARANGMAGSFGALGADLSVFNTNPAGIALYRKGEFSFSPGFDIFNSNSEFYGNQRKDNDFRLTMGSVGTVGVYDIGDGESGWVNAHLGIAYNRSTSFNSRITIEGFNPTSTILDVMAYQANGTHPDDLMAFYENTASLAWETYLINPAAGGNFNYTPEIQSGTTQQTKTIDTQGSMGMTDIAFGANYNNQVFIGGSIGFPRIRDSQISILREDPSDTTSTLDYFEYFENLSTRGNGVQVKMGAIVRPSNFFRFGLAFHSPIFLTLTHDWYYSMESNFEDGSNFVWETPQSSFAYRLTTPWKAMASAAFLFGKQGVVNVDYEFQDFSTGRLSNTRRGGTYSFTLENDNIQTFMGQTHNLRIGGEWRIDNMRVRAGYAYYSNPYNGTLVATNTARSVYSVGTGVRYSDWYLDFAYALHAWKTDHVLYDPSIVDVAKINNGLSNVTVTLGFRY